MKTEKIEQYCRDFMEKDNEEPLLNEKLSKKQRFCFYPIEYKDIYDAYLKHLSMFWRPSEI